MKGLAQNQEIEIWGKIRISVYLFIYLSISILIFSPYIRWTGNINKPYSFSVENFPIVHHLKEPKQFDNGCKIDYFKAEFYRHKRT